MVFAIEPMVNAGDPATTLLEDGWSVVTADGRLSAHFEHTIAVTDERSGGADSPLSGAAGPPGRAPAGGRPGGKGRRTGIRPSSG